MAGFAQTGPGALIGGLGILIAACGGGGGGNTTPSTTAIAKASAGSGDGQAGVVGQALAQPLKVVVTDGGAASAGATVTWSTTVSGGALNPATATTDANGNATSVWTLGTVAGSQTATATLSGATGSPVTFNATASAQVPVPTTAAVYLGDIFFVSIHNGSLNPAVDTVAVNGTVTWTWGPTAALPHSVESSPPNFTSSAIQAGAGKTYQFTFTTPGTYQYDCAVHGSQMTGRIVVR